MHFMTVRPMNGYLVGLDLHGQGIGRRAVLAQVKHVRVALKAAAPHSAAGWRVRRRAWKGIGAPGTARFCDCMSGMWNGDVKRGGEFGGDLADLPCRCQCRSP